MSSNETIIKLQIFGGMATPAPPIAPALGGKGVNTRDFCTEFNARTQKQKGEVLRVWVRVRADKKFTIEIKGTPASMLIKKMAHVDKGSATPNLNKVGKISLEQLKQIAESKKNELNVFTQDAALNVLKGTARSMGVEVTS